MGLHFGVLPVRIRRVLYYGIAPMEQRAFAKMISHGLPNLVRRGLYAIVEITPGTLLGVWTITWGLKEHDRANRKDPKLYQTDKKSSNK